MNKSIAKWVYKYGAKRRNPDLFKVAEKLKSSDFFSQEQYEEIKRNKLNAVLDNAFANSAYYKEGPFIKKEDPFETLRLLPILTKKELIDNHDKLQCYSGFDVLFESETSGSSGEPLRFKKDLNWDTHNRATIIRSCWWFNVNPWDRNGYFWGFQFSGKERLKTLFLDSFQNRFRAFSYNPEEIKDFLKKLKSANLLHGYSSMIYESAKMALDLGLGPKDFPKLKMIKGTSEKIHDYYKETVLSAFGQSIVSEYGAAETGIIAFECPHGNMHVNEENVILEEVDGEAIVTNLNAFSLPVFRYKLGDAISLNNERRCKCGRSGYIIEEVVGRSGKKILGLENSYPSLTLYYVFKNMSNNYGLDLLFQGVQKEKGKLDLLIETALKPNEFELIKKECQSYFKNDVDVTVIDKSETHSKKGKRMDFITLLK